MMICGVSQRPFSEQVIAKLVAITEADQLAAEQLYARIEPAVLQLRGLVTAEEQPPKAPG
jgi:hypothetical protein